MLYMRRALYSLGPDVGCYAPPILYEKELNESLQVRTLQIAMVHQWLRNGSGMVPKWFSNGSKIVHQLFRNGSAMVPKCFSNGSAMALQWFLNGTAMVPK